MPCSRKGGRPGIFSKKMGERAEAVMNIEPVGYFQKQGNVETPVWYRNVIDEMECGERWRRRRRSRILRCCSVVCLQYRMGDDASVSMRIVLFWIEDGSVGGSKCARLVCRVVEGRRNSLPYRVFSTRWCVHEEC